MSNRNHIQDELNGLNSELPLVPGQSPFSVPEGYFAGLADSIMAKIQSQELSSSEEIASLSPLLSEIPRTMPYAVPLDYFEQTLEALPSVVGKDPVSPILSLIERIDPYETPSGYFINFPKQVLDSLNQPSQTKVIPIRRRRIGMAVAAVVAGIIILAGYLYSGPENSIDTQKPIAQQLKNISTKELEDFIKTTDISSTSTETVQHLHSRHVEVQKLLNDVSDNELNAFLNQIPTEDEELSVSN